MKTATISAEATAVILHRKLGPLRAWSDFLTDNRREKQSIDGITLLPCCIMHDGRARRPRYRLEDVARFIKAVQKGCPTERAEDKVVELDIDSETPWFLQRFDRHGLPLTRH